jgi:hypothetical protein
VCGVHLRSYIHAYFFDRLDLSLCTADDALDEDDDDVDAADIDDIAPIVVITNVDVDIVVITTTFLVQADALLRKCIE